MLHGLRTTDDPGLQRRVLASSNAIDLRLPRAYPRCLMARLCLAEALVMALLTLALIGALWVLP